STEGNEGKEEVFEVTGRKDRRRAPFYWEAQNDRLKIFVNSVSFCSLKLRRCGVLPGTRGQCRAGRRGVVGPILRHRPSYRGPAFAAVSAVNRSRSGRP